MKYVLYRCRYIFSLVLMTSFASYVAGSDTGDRTTSFKQRPGVDVKITIFYNV
jgi:hypothetical protein